MPSGDERVDVDAWSLSYARIGAAGRVVRRGRGRGSRKRAWPSTRLLIVPSRVRSSRCRHRLGAHQRTWPGGRGPGVLAQRRRARGGGGGQRGARPGQGAITTLPLDKGPEKLLAGRTG